MDDKLKEVENRYDELNALLASPDVASDHEQYAKFAKEQSEIEEVVKTYRQCLKTTKEIADSKEIIKDSDDAELKQMAQAELDELVEQEQELQKKLMILLIPKDPNDDKNVICEIRAGTGGDEAALFAADLFSMYSRFAESNKWKVEIFNTSESTVGGFKEIVFQITGDGAFSKFKYESGVHRVQRVPATETQGRVHTSTVTVAVLPEAEDVEIDIEEKDVRVDVFRASGPGGQSVNTTDSAVRVTHIPTGIVATCQDGKSQHKNKRKAMMVLKARINDQMKQEQDSERSENRRSQIGTGERSEKIRTYNFPQGRVTDHRVALTLYKLETVLSGDLQLLIEPILAHFQAESLA